LTTRKIALIESVIELIVFSAISFFIILSLFHAAILAAPLFAFLWTFFGFSLLAIILGRRIKFGYVISFAFLNFLFSSCLLFILVNETVLKISGTAKTISIILLAIIVVLYPILVVATIKAYLRNRKLAT